MERKKIAGVAWFTDFMPRQPSLSLRNPEATRLSRTTSLNPSNVNHFFIFLLGVIKKYKFNDSDIWNIDEIGITTVQKPVHVIAGSGQSR